VRTPIKKSFFSGRENKNIEDAVTLGYLSDNCKRDKFYVLLQITTETKINLKE
jgi:hypothetical protein